MELIPLLKRTIFQLPKQVPHADIDVRPAHATCSLAPTYQYAHGVMLIQRFQIYNISQFFHQYHLLFHSLCICSTPPAQVILARLSHVTLLFFIIIYYCFRNTTYLPFIDMGIIITLII